VSINGEIRELYDRVRAIEASPAGGGIKFDTYPQAGEWLYVEAGNGLASPNGYAIELLDTATTGIHVASLGRVTIEGDDRVSAISGGASMVVDDAGGASLVADATLGAGTAQQVQLQAFGDADSNIQLRAEDNASHVVAVSVDAGTSFYPARGLHVRLPSVGIVQVLDSSTSPDPSGLPIFEVREDGTIHGLASVGAITWDL
jgi:hypothetical protein